MKLLNTKIKGPKIIKTQIYKDSRGFLKEVYKKNLLSKIDFPFDVMSHSKKNVLRGLHIQTKKRNLNLDQHLLHKCPLHCFPPWPDQLLLLRLNLKSLTQKQKD